MSQRARAEKRVTFEGDRTQLAKALQRSEPGKRAQHYRKGRKRNLSRARRRVDRALEEETVRPPIGWQDGYCTRHGRYRCGPCEREEAAQLDYGVFVWNAEGAVPEGGGDRDLRVARSGEARGGVSAAGGEPGDPDDAEGEGG